MAQFRAGDFVVFRITKFSTDPGPRAKDVHPAPYGETYNYYVDKYWAVQSVSADGQLDLVTRRGKHHQVPANDPRLRHATLFERWFQADRFPKPDVPPHKSKRDDSSTTPSASTSLPAMAGQSR